MALDIAKGNKIKEAEIDNLGYEVEFLLPHTIALEVGRAIAEIEALKIKDEMVKDQLIEHALRSLEFVATEDKK